MARKGELKAVDQYEQDIRDNAVAYTVICFEPGKSSRAYATFEDLKYSIEYGKQVLRDLTRVRAAMIYALDEHDHHALVGTINRDMNFKEVVPKVY